MATRRYRIDGDALDAIGQLALTTDWTPAQILRDIEGKKELSDKVPNLRTVQRITKDFRAEDNSEPWSLRDSDGDEAKLILEVRRELIRYWNHPTKRIQRLSKQEARWVVKVRKAAPELDTRAVWLVALMYSLRETGEISTEDLDDYLAFAPWKDTQHFDEYKQWIRMGWISLPPLSDQLVDDLRPDDD